MNIGYGYVEDVICIEMGEYSISLVEKGPPK